MKSKIFFTRLNTLTVKVTVRTMTEKYSPGSAPLARLSLLLVLVLLRGVLHEVGEVVYSQAENT